MRAWPALALVVGARRRRTPRVSNATNALFGAGLARGADDLQRSLTAKPRHNLPPGRRRGGREDEGRFRGRVLVLDGVEDGGAEPFNVPILPGAVRLHREGTSITAPSAVRGDMKDGAGDVERAVTPVLHADVLLVPGEAVHEGVVLDVPLPTLLKRAVVDDDRLVAHVDVPSVSASHGHVAPTRAVRPAVSASDANIAPAPAVRASVPSSNRDGSAVGCARLLRLAAARVALQLREGRSEEG